MNTPNKTFFGIDPNSTDFGNIVETACHYIGSRERFATIVEGAMPGSRTQLSDSIAVTLALGQSALDLAKPEFALQLTRHFMGLFHDRIDAMTDDEIRDIEALFLRSFAATDPKAAAAAGITDEFLANYKGSRNS